MRNQSFFRNGQRVFWILSAVAVAALLAIQLEKYVSKVVSDRQAQENCTSHPEHCASRKQI